jgi:hypothetical protein
MKPVETSKGERIMRGRGKGDNPTQEGGDPEGTGGRNPYTPMLPGNGNRPRYTPRREPETPRGYGRREEYEGERGQRGRGKSVSLPMSLKFDGKSNWKAFFAKFSRYAEVSEWTEGECRDQLCWCLDETDTFPPSPLTSFPFILLPSSISSRGFRFSSGGVPRPVPITW